MAIQAAVQSSETPKPPARLLGLLRVYGLAMTIGLIRCPLDIL